MRIRWDYFDRGRIPERCAKYLWTTKREYPEVKRGIRLWIKRWKNSRKLF